MHKSWIGVTVLLLFFGWNDHPIFSSAPCTNKEKKGSQASNLNVKEIRQKDTEMLEKMRIETSSLVADAYQVVGELLDGVGGNTRLDVLGVVGDEESLLGLDDDQTFLALITCQLTDVRE